MGCLVVIVGILAGFAAVGAAWRGDWNGVLVPLGICAGSYVLLVIGSLARRED